MFVTSPPSKLVRTPPKLDLDLSEYNNDPRMKEIAEAMIEMNRRKKLEEDYVRIWDPLPQENPPVSTIRKQPQDPMMPDRRKDREDLDKSVSDISLYVEFKLLEFEQNRKLQVEKKVLEQKKRLSRLIDDITASSMAKLEERMKELKFKEAEDDRVLQELDDKWEKEQQKLQQKHIRKQKEFEARMQAVFQEAEVAAEKEEESFRQEEQKQKAAEAQAELRRQEAIKGRILPDFKILVSNLRKLLLETKNVLDQGFVQQLMSRNDLDLKAAENMSHDIGFEANKAVDFMAKISEVSKVLKNQLSEVEEHRQRREEEESQRLQEQARQQEQVRQREQEATKVEVAATIPESQQHDDVSPGNLQRYQQLINFKNEIENALLALKTDESQKPFISLCMKAVNTPVNSIGRATSAHLMDKINKLSRLLRGEVVKVMDDQFSAASHPLGIPFCKSLLARGLLKQGEEVVRAQPKDAFTVGAVIIALWAEFPDLGDLFLAHVFAACPFLVPIHFGRKEGMKDEEYYKILGYTYNDENKVEDQVTYESRLGGVCRLYAAVMVSILPKDGLRQGKEHPCGIGNAWRWLASCLNLRPINGITATLMLNILEVCGNEMLNLYRGQFLAMLYVIAQSYLDLLKPVSLEGPLTNLKTLLEVAIRTNTIKPPEGMLSQGFL